MRLMQSGPGHGSVQRLVVYEPRPLLTVGGWHGRTEHLTASVSRLSKSDVICSGAEDLLHCTIVPVRFVVSASHLY